MDKNGRYKGDREYDKTLWVAHVIEIKPGLVLVEWYFRPEELATGRKGYHGPRELIKTDNRDIIETDTVCGRTAVLDGRELNIEDIKGHLWRERLVGSILNVYDVYHSPANKNRTCDWKGKKKHH